MLFKIWHANHPRFGFGEQPKFPEAYTKIAHVEADSVADTFRITNHIDSDWLENPEVQWNISGGMRSTSVGDVVEDENGDFYRCENVGWEKMKLNA